MPHALFRFLAIGLCALCCCAHGQLSTKDTSLHGPTITHNNRTVIQPRTMAMHVPLDEARVLRPSIDIDRIDELGYNINYTFTNDTDTPKPLGRLVVGAITLDEHVHYLSLKRGSQLKYTTWDNYTGQIWRYPTDAYSPVCAIMDGKHAVGASLLYPIDEYKHDVGVRLANPGGVFKGPKNARGWFIAFDLSNAKGANQYTRLVHEAILQPGEHRTYTVAVRVMERSGTPTADPAAPQDWLETLLPYRDYFHNRYGGVDYERNPKPVRAREAANGGAISARNPRGFFGDKTSRPDIAGFGQLARILAKPDGFDRVMLWAPSGLYNTDRKLNYPTQFTSGWNDLPLLRTTYRQLNTVKSAGKELGLWWGRSSQFADRWNPTSLESIDLSNREHLRSISEQLEMARNAGATAVGLDNFNHAHIPVWEQARLLGAIKRIFPELRFIAEPMCCDIIHAEIPGFVTAYQSPKDARREVDFHKLRTPNYLADFLLPGHENWALFRYSEIQRVDRTRITPAREQRDAEHLARLGYVPVMLSSYDLSNPARAIADETWRTTVPEHLQIRPQPTADHESTDDP
ncbi:MAG: hypothetical protein Phyf2KO_26560 [Phycisphaerales bacterium]